MFTTCPPTSGRADTHRAMGKYRITGGAPHPKMGDVKAAKKWSEKHQHTSGKASTRKRRRSDDSVTMQITTTRIIQRALDRIVLTGLYGNSRAAAAERLLSEGIRQLLKEGTILRVSKIFLDKSK